jgi:aspartic proteinase inhibitor
MTDVFLFTKWLLTATLLGISLLAIPAPPIPVKNLPGGYSAVGLTDDIKAAAEFAVQEAKRDAVVLKLSDISKAERQIVAGVNYRLDVVVKRSGSARKAGVVVFKDLKSHYKLTSWEWLNQ